MGTKNREIVEFAGLKTYFFPNLALYAECNDELIAYTPDKANPVASFIFGGTENVPTEQQIIDILLPDNANPETLYTGMDACLALGGHFISHFETLIARLQLLKHNHEFAKVIESEDTKGILSIGRKARLQKGPNSNFAAKIIWTIVKIMLAKEKETKFLHILDLCSMDLEFDAFVLIKLLGLENEKNRKEVKQIEEMVMEKLKPKLKELMINGPMDEYTRLLTITPIEQSAQKLIAHHVLLFKHILSAEEEDGFPNSEIQKRRLTFQLIFFISRAVASGNVHVARQMLTWIPGPVRKEMFPGLQNNRVEKTLDYLDSVFKIFMNSSPVSFKSWTPVGIDNYLDNPWSRRSIAAILESFRFAVTRGIFEEGSIKLVPTSKLPNDELTAKMEKSIRCAMWILENYRNYTKEAVQLITFLDNSVEFAKDIKKALEPEVPDEPEVAPEVSEDLVLKTEDVRIPDSNEKSLKVPKSEVEEEPSQSVSIKSERRDSFTEQLKQIRRDLMDEKAQNKNVMTFQKPSEQNAKMASMDANHNYTEKLYYTRGRTECSPTPPSSLDSHGWVKTENLSPFEVALDNVLMRVGEKDQSPVASKIYYPMPKFPTSFEALQKRRKEEEEKGIKISPFERPRSTFSRGTNARTAFSGSTNSSFIQPATPLILSSFKPKGYYRRHPRPPPINNFIVTGYGLAEQAKGFGMTVDPKSRPRRLFGGVGTGEKSEFSGYV